MDVIEQAFQFSGKFLEFSDNDRSYVNRSTMHQAVRYLMTVVRAYAAPETAAPAQVEPHSRATEYRDRERATGALSAPKKRLGTALVTARLTVSAPAPALCSLVSDDSTRTWYTAIDRDVPYSRSQKSPSPLSCPIIQGIIFD